VWVVRGPARPLPICTGLDHWQSTFRFCRVAVHSDAVFRGGTWSLYASCWMNAVAATVWPSPR